MKKLPFALSCLVLLLAACKPIEFPGPGRSDFSADFGNGYILARTSGVYVVIAPQKGYSSDTEIIDTRVLECGYDARFIIAKRLNIKSIPEDKWGDALLNPPPDLIDYWIIETLERKRHGPLTQSEFQNECLRIGIPPEMQLRNIYDYRPKNEGA
ncbi:MAG: DUF3997 domain-containing protein [Opitutaceae bacterium]|jgi:hypothetical protein